MHDRQKGKGFATTKLLESARICMCAVDSHMVSENLHKHVLSAVYNLRVMTWTLRAAAKICLLMVDN